jgi:hypothetical protein
MTKKYILIQNDGEIETNSFELIGASTKREDSTKIGFFGSGLKYSIAYMMRKGIEFRVFSGLNEILFSSVKEPFRGQEFERICINGKPTSYTTTMGPTWQEDWFIVREIYCNAMDESNPHIIKETENVNPVEGKTRIYLECTESLKSIVDNWDAYFSLDRTPLFEARDVYTSFLSDKKSNQTVKIYSKTKNVIYRKQIKVGEESFLAFDYGFDEVEINEDRTASKMGALCYTYSNLMAKFVAEEYVTKVLRLGGIIEDPCEEYNALFSPSTFIHDPSEKWVEFSKKYLLVVEEKSGRFIAEMQASAKEIFYLPTGFAKWLKKHLPQMDILGIGQRVGNCFFTEVETTPKMEFLLKEVINSLKEMKYEITFPVSVVQFESSHIQGQADITNKHIYLAEDLFDRGRREIALTLIEEQEHLVSSFGDETRAFQSHLISSWLTTMENSNGLFL